MEQKEYKKWCGGAVDVSKQALHKELCMNEHVCELRIQSRCMLPLEKLNGNKDEKLSILKINRDETFLLFFVKISHKVDSYPPHNSSMKIKSREAGVGQRDDLYGAI